MSVSIVLVLVLVLYGTVNCVPKNGLKTCSQLAAVTQDISPTVILKNPVEGHNLKICQSNLTCCSRQMEKELYIESSRILKDAVHQLTNATQNFLTTQASLFDDYFKNLLSTAKMKWHNLLLLTYKDMYERNRHIFDDFFSSLEKYYMNGDVDLDRSFNLFFQRIQNTMFILIDKKLANKPEFLNCTAKRIDEIQPFGEYQSLITNRLRSSLIQARTFVLGLQVGGNVTASVVNYLSRNECREGFTKIQHCSVCEGIPDALVCNVTCHNLLYSCFLLDPLFDAYWRDFIGGVHALSSRLDGQYNFEAIVGQLAYDISSAIMEFQTNFIAVLAKAQTLCPSGSRRKRAIDKSGDDLYLEGGRVRRSQDGLMSLLSVTKQQPPPLDKFTTDFRKQLNQLKDVWKHMPHRICGGQTFVSRDLNSTCWNGIGMQKNSGKVPKVNLNNVDDNSRRLIVEQLLNLTLAVGNLKRVRVDLGNVVDFDPESASGEPGYSGSGSGSGSGDESGVTSGSGDPTKLPELIPSQSPSVVSATNRKPSTTPSDGTTDKIDGSGTHNEYSTTPTNVLNKSTTDDEDLEVSGSGENDTEVDISTTTDTNILFNPTRHEDDTDVLVKNIIATKPRDNGAAKNIITLSYLLSLIVIPAGLLNM